MIRTDMNNKQWMISVSIFFSGILMFSIFPNVSEIYPDILIIPFTMLAFLWILSCLSIVAGIVHSFLKGF
jgi:glucan phosphoethanolaminetransferase (alkaline phosphatase superfamily)